MKTKTTFLATVFFLSSAAVAFSQAPIKQWDLRFGGNFTDELSTLQQTSDGGYILGGITSSDVIGDVTQPPRGSYDYWIVKIDPFGVKQWDARFGGTGNDYLTSLQQTTDGGYILGGYTDSGISGDKTQASQGHNDYWIVKTDALGKKQWDARFGGSNFDQCTCVHQTPDGGYILGGYSKSGVGGDKTQASRGSDDYWIVKTDATGVKQWDKRFGGTDIDQLYALESTDDGGYLLAGTTFSGAGGDISQTGPGQSDYWIVKTDANGIKQWDYRYGGIYSDNLRAMRKTADNGFILGGSSNSPAGADKTQNVQGAEDYWILKTDANGIKQWDAGFGGTSSDQLFSNSLWQTNDGGYLVGGFSLSGIGGDKTQANQGSRDYWIVKTNDNGVKQWDVNYGGNSDDNLYAAVQTSDGGYIYGGGSSSGISGDKTQASRGGEDFWIVKTDFDDTPNSISTATVSPLNYVPGQHINISYTVNGVFGTGNVFTAQLSAQDGSFNAPINIGSLSSASSGLIHATIPQTVSYGAAYRVRVVSSSPAMAGTDNGQNITIGHSSAPLQQWDMDYGGNGYEILSCSQHTSDGGYILGGWSGSGISGDKTQSNQGGYDYWIVKTDVNGAKKWDARFGGTGDDNLTALQQTSDGGYILGGFSISQKNGDKSQPSKGLYDYWIVKTDSNGAKQWDKTIGGNDFDYLYAVLQTPDGGYLLGGQSLSDSGASKSQNNHPGGWDMWVVKTNASGIQQWDVTLGGTDDDYLSSMVATDDGGYILAGSSASPLSGDKTQDNWGTIYTTDYWIVKIDGNGVKQWDYRYGGTGDEVLHSIIKTTDGGYLLGGTTNSFNNGDITQPDGNWWIVKTDVNGLKQWDARYGTQTLTSLKQTSDGGYILGGYTAAGISGDKTQPTQGGEDYWIIKTDQNGIQQWDADFGGSADDQLSSILQTPDGYLLAGWTSSGLSGNKTQASKGATDFWIVKTDAGGTQCIIPSGMTATNITASSAKLNWNSTAIGVKYQVRYKVTGTNSWTKVSASSNSKKIIGLIPSTQYDWEVRSICDAQLVDGSPWSETQNFTTGPLKLSSSENFSLFDVYPNPVSAGATIAFSLNEDSKVVMELFGVDGRKIMTIADKNCSAGNQQISFQKGSLRAGIYFLEIKSEEGVVTKKIVIE